MAEYARVVADFDHYIANGMITGSTGSTGMP